MPTLLSTPTIDNFTQASGSTLISKPASVAVGTFLVWNVLNGTTGAPQTITTPSGWNLVSGASTTLTGTVRGMNSAIFWRIATSTDVSASTYTTTGGTGGTGAGMASIMAAYSGCVGIGNSSVNKGDHTGTTITATGITVVQPTIIGAFINSWETDHGPLTSMTDQKNSGGNGLEFNDQSISPGATGNKTCTCASTESWIVSLYELIPATSSMFFGAGTTS